MDVILHWIHYNVYPQSIVTTKVKIEKHVKEFSFLKRYLRKKKKETYWNRVETFIARANKDSGAVLKCKNDTCNEDFYRNQCLVPQVCYCSTFIDRKWKKSYLRKQVDAERSANAQLDAQEYERTLHTPTSFIVLSPV